MGLERAGFNISFLPCEDGGEEIGPRGIPHSVTCLRPLLNGKLSFSAANFEELHLHFRSILGAVKPNLILAGPIQSGGFLAALAKFHPLLVMSWGYDVLSIPHGSEWLRSVTKFTLEQADVVLGDCEAVRDAVCVLGAIPRDRTVCFPWGIELDLFRPDACANGLREQLGWQGCKIIVSGRSFELIHGTMTFLEAMRQVLKRRDDARVLMLGDGPLRFRVEGFIEEHGLGNRIHLAGRVPEEILPGHFVEADLYVSASQCDGSSISLLEAMGCGLATVVPNVGGNCEWVRNEVNGWLYPAGDADALATLTMHALDADITRREMGSINVRIVRERANWDLNFRKLLAVCNKLLALSRSRTDSAYAELHGR